jgi:hypothetical protein
LPSVLVSFAIYPDFADDGDESIRPVKPELNHVVVYLLAV